MNKDDLFLQAVREDNLAELKKLLDEGANINAKDEEKNKNALEIAISNENMEIVKFLLENGINLDNQEYYLGKAIAYSDFILFQLLVEAGCDIHKEASRFNYYLHYKNYLIEAMYRGYIRETVPIIVL